MKLQVDRSVCPAFWKKVELAYDLDTLDGCLCCGLPYDLASGKVDSIKIDPEHADIVMDWCKSSVWDIILFTEEPTPLLGLAALQNHLWTRINLWPTEPPFPIWIEP